MFRIFVRDNQAMVDLRNWAANYAYRAAAIHTPTGLDELRRLVADSPLVKALGTRHSFNDIADTAGDLVSLEKLTQIDEPDAATQTVTLESGVRYGELCAHLHARRLALHNLASLPHISVAGAVATATHGSGVGNGNLATAVRAMTVVDGGGNLRSVSRESNSDTFDGMVVSLGALGVVANITLDIVPAFDVRQVVFQNLPLVALEHHFADVMSSAYSVSLFTDWRADSINQVWMKQRVGDPEPLDLTALGAKRATVDVHPIANCPPENCTKQLGVPGPWHQRLPHFRMEFTPSAGEELQSEYFVPREQGFDAMRAVRQIADRVSPVLQISEIRTIAADDLWLSPCYRRDSVALHFTWRKDWPTVRDVLPLIESQLAPFDPRPHWGKLFTMPPAKLRSKYPKLPEFVELMRQFDPTGKFRNRFLDEFIS